MIEVLKYKYLLNDEPVPLSASECSAWASASGATHVLLRDDRTVENALQLSVYDALVLDSDLKIVFRQSSIWASFYQTDLLEALATAVGS